jgi:hypothetical protein
MESTSELQKIIDKCAKMEKALQKICDITDMNTLINENGRTPFDVCQEIAYDALH